MTRILGIDLGTTAIKVAEVTVEGREKYITGLYEFPGGDFASLRNFLQSMPTPADRVAVGIGAIPLVFKKFYLDFADKSRLFATASAEFEDTLPLPIERQLIDIKPFKKTGRLWTSLAASTPLENVQELQNLIVDQIGIKPHSLLLDHEALAQLALSQLLPEASHAQPYILLDIGESVSKLALISGSYLLEHYDILELRSLGRGANSVIDLLAQQMQCKPEQAESWLIHKAQIENESTQTSDQIKNALRPLLVEIFQNIQSFRSRYGSEGMRFDAMYITGGISKLPGFCEFLSQELHIRVEVWDALQGYENRTGDWQPDNANKYALALALANRYTQKKPHGWLNFRIVSEDASQRSYCP